MHTAVGEELTLEDRTIHFFARTLAAQLRQPAGLLGWLVGEFMDRENAALNALVRSHLAVGPGAAVLEVGCGTGRSLVEVATAVAPGLVVGIEPSRVMARRARRRCRRRGVAEQVAVHEATVATMVLAPHAFDAAYAVNVIYFWDDPVGALRALRAALRPGGQLVLGFEPRAELEARAITRHGFHLYTGPEVAALCREAGFRSVTTREESVGPFGAVIVLAVA